MVDGRMNLMPLLPRLSARERENCKIALWGWAGPSRRDADLLLVKLARLIHKLHSAGIPSKAEEFRALARKLKLEARHAARSGPNHSPRDADAADG
jgi:hypothetical protein